LSPKNRDGKKFKGGVNMKLIKAFLVVLCIAALNIASAPAVMAQTDNTTEEATATFEVTNLVIEPSETTVGRTVTIKANVTNTGNIEGTYATSLEINGKVEGSQNVTLAAGQTKLIEFTYTPSSVATYAVTIGGATATLKVTLPATEAKFRVGPVVKLRPVIDEIDSSHDGLVEVFFSNPSLNDVTLQVEMYVSVPSGIHVQGLGFGLAAAAGTVYGQFTAPPGTARTIYLNIKADKTAVGKKLFIHFEGLYWPGDNKDAYNPISLTHSFTVREESDNLDPIITNPGDIPPPAPPPGPGNILWGIWIGWWIILAVVVLGGIAAIVAVSSRKTEVSIEK